MTGLPLVTGDLGNYYGQRIQAYYVAPETGDFLFSISAIGSSAELRISPDRSVLHKVLVAYCASSVAPGVYNFEDSQSSAPIRLVRGESYYMEVLQHSQHGAGHLSVRVVVRPDLRL